ncbi:tRNA threonylcarbamoyladenosine biosynthesis protein TsaB [Candidatus Magnetomoraceae bacterium gMMP-15]
MKILAVDTAANGCSTAITDGHSLIAETTFISRETHSRHLMSIIVNLLKTSKCCIEEIDGFVVIKGPGSFTGLRISMSTIKGLAMASGKPIAGISALDVLVEQFPCFNNSFGPDLIYPIMDARRNEIYTATYKYSVKGIIKVSDEMVIHPLQLIKNINKSCIFLGEGAWLYKKLFEDALEGKVVFAPPYFNIIRASTAAFLSLRRFEKNDTDDIASFAPYYIRKSDAEIKKS